ncbi:hypothetical protein [Bacillus mesophilum]|nr:hypothetical protein [Bacillus mesophilum]
MDYMQLKHGSSSVSRVLLPALYGVIEDEADLGVLKSMNERQKKVCMQI